MKRLLEEGAILLNVQGNRAGRVKKTILFEPERARWLEIQAARERRDISDILGEALALYEQFSREESS